MIFRKNLCLAKRHQLRVCVNTCTYTNMYEYMYAYVYMYMKIQVYMYIHKNQYILRKSNEIASIFTSVFDCSNTAAP